MSNVKFVVLSLSRSGTSHLVATLNESAEVLMHDEIFHPDIWPHIRDESSELRDIYPRLFRAIAYADGVLSECPPGKTHVGFKMWHDQSPEACNHLMRDRNVYKIILERQNRLASYSSLSKAYRTDVWNVSKGDDLGDGYAAQSIEEFDVADFVDHVERRNAIFRHYREYSRGPTLNITYTGLVHGADYQRCMKFLGLTPPTRKSAEYQRLNSPDILSRFAESDRAKIIAAITELGHPEWAEPESRTALVDDDPQPATKA